MSLQEACERVEKLKRMAASGNPHEASAAAAHIKAFDIDAARAPRTADTPGDTGPAAEKNVEASFTHAVEVLDEWPVEPCKDLGELEVEQPPGQSPVTWDVLHADLLDRARTIGAHAVLNIQIKGTRRRKILAGTALAYLTPREILQQQAATKLEDDEKAYREAQKERRDEDWAPPVG